MKRATGRTAATPLRALLVVLVLAGFGLWQAWQCSDGMPASPITGMHAMVMTSDHDATHVATAAPATASPVADPAMPPGMTGLCITVVASLAAALALFVFGAQGPALMDRVARPTLRPGTPAVAGGLSLTLLCVQRT